MPVFDHGDLRLHYAARGAVDGPPVVLLHGLLWSAPMFERLAGRLPGRRVLLLDPHGHGKSDKPTDADRYTPGAFPDDALAPLDPPRPHPAPAAGLSLRAHR